MIVFKTFLKVLNKCKFVIILYTVMLILFGGFNMQTSEKNMSFTPSKPDVLIINKDEETGITKNLIDYISSKSNIKQIEKSEDSINDALFYRDINYIIYIPENYGRNFLKGNNPKIEVKSTGDYQSSLAEMMLERYVNVANVYRDSIEDEEELINKINETLEKETEVEITSKLDTSNLEKMAFYYNFASYALLAGCVYVICLILSSFKEERINRRTIISSMNYRKYNLILLLSNMLFAAVLWALYVLVSFVLIGDTMFTANGLICIINSFAFTICCTAIAFLIGNVINNKNAINGIVNVVALGSSFLCGAFVPMQWLPDIVLKIAHVLPTYYYIKTNEILKTLEEFNFEALLPVIVNFAMILGFTVVFVVLVNIVSKRKRKS